MRIYINENTEEVLSRMENGDRELFSSELYDVKSSMRFDLDTNKLIRFDWFEVDYNKDYLRFNVNKCESDNFERKISRVLPQCAMKQFIHKEVIEDIFNDKVMFSLKVNGFIY